MNKEEICMKKYDWKGTACTDRKVLRWHFCGSTPCCGYISWWSQNTCWISDGKHRHSLNHITWCKWPHVDHIYLWCMSGNTFIKSFVVSFRPQHVWRCQQLHQDAVLGPEHEEGRERNLLPLDLCHRHKERRDRVQRRDGHHHQREP